MAAAVPQVSCKAKDEEVPEAGAVLVPPVEVAVTFAAEVAEEEAEEGAGAAPRKSSPQALYVWTLAYRPRISL